MDSDKPTEGYTYKYPHPAVATDCVVFGFDGKELKVLLIERGQPPFKGMWAFPGGFLRMEETAEECVRRELCEETGLKLDNIRQLGTFSGVFRDPRERVISIAFYALARHSAVKGGDDAASARWWPIDEIPQLAFDHDYILRQAMKRIRQDIHFEPVGFGLLDEEFTIAELQRLYESILGVHFDRRNFYRKMLQTGVLQEVEEPPKPAFYGKRKEMKKMDIDDLFGGAEKESPVQYCACAIPDVTGEPEPPMPVASGRGFSRSERIKRIHELLKSQPSEDTETGAPAPEPERNPVGRKGKLYRFDQESYNRMKEDGNFRLEF